LIEYAAIMLIEVVVYFSVPFLLSGEAIPSLTIIISPHTSPPCFPNPPSAVGSAWTRLQLRGGRAGEGARRRGNVPKIEKRGVYNKIPNFSQRRYKLED
jgi:hypothetical protein